MGRPAASNNNKQLAALFAAAVTVKTNKAAEVVARSGRCSLYNALCTCVNGSSDVVRFKDTDRTFRHGISQPEFNKVLEKSGFFKARDRRTKAIEKSRDPEGAGLYLFGYRRWRDPTDPKDLSELEKAWTELSRIEEFASNCTFQNFISVINHFKTSWRPRSNRLLNPYASRGQGSEELTAVPSCASPEDSPVAAHAPFAADSRLPSGLSDGWRSASVASTVSTVDGSWRSGSSSRSSSSLSLGSAVDRVESSDFAAQPAAGMHLAAYPKNLQRPAWSCSSFGSSGDEGPMDFQAFQAAHPPPQADGWFDQQKMFFNAHHPRAQAPMAAHQAIAAIPPQPTGPMTHCSSHQPSNHLEATQNPHPMGGGVKPVCMTEDTPDLRDEEVLFALAQSGNIWGECLVKPEAPVPSIAIC